MALLIPFYKVWMPTMTCTTARDKRQWVKIKCWEWEIDQLGVMWTREFSPGGQRLSKAFSKTSIWTSTALIKLSFCLRGGKTKEVVTLALQDSGIPLDTNSWWYKKTQGCWGHFGTISHDYLRSLFSPPPRVGLGVLNAQVTLTFPIKVSIALNVYLSLELHPP